VTGADFTSPKIMGILNVSAESFFKKSIALSQEAITKKAIELEHYGADIIDIGAMSTAPYLETVIPVDEEMRRMRLAIHAVQESCNLPISIDTPRAKVAKIAIEYGTEFINDVTGLKYDNQMARTISQANISSIRCAYENGEASSGNIFETNKALEESLRIARKSGIDENKIIIDPSIGFFRKDGKNPFYTRITDCEWYERDIGIISTIEKLSQLSKPICVSLSNKSFLGQLLNLKPEERVIPSVVCEIICVLKGANIIRTHNVRETSLAIRTLKSIENRMEK
jgi:dihydropteroate synthase